VIKKSNFIVGFKGINKLNNFIKVQKDKTNFMSKNNVVYKILCNNCDASYVGQTKRQVQTRIKEHTNNIRLEPSRYSVITEHILEFNHSFDWKNIKILDYEPNYNKRLISEMLHIKEQRHGINSQKNTECLDDSYFCLLNAISNGVC